MGLGSLILAISASTLTVINAAPQPEQSLDVNILAPTTIGVYFCPEAFWKGECEYLQNGPGICIKLDTSLAAQVSSVGPDEDASGCTFYENDNCSGLQLKVKHPGVDNLPSTPQSGKYNDFIRSYICY